jgi:precorrin-3B synthase
MNTPENKSPGVKGPEIKGPEIKGWCPGAHRPMMSGDGLVVRVRPKLARLDRAQVQGLCKLSTRFGSGFIDLTNRANLQIRGVDTGDHDALLKGLAQLGLLDADPALESRRNILVSPLWRTNDLTYRLTQALLQALPTLPEMPAKVGFAVDTGAAPLLAHNSADFRFERGANGLILRADGSATGRPVTEDTALTALAELVDWFNTRRSAQAHRMATVLHHHSLPTAWTTTLPLSHAPQPHPDRTPMGQMFGAGFGQIDASELKQVMADPQITGLRVTPWRLFLLEGGQDAATPFITRADDPLLNAHACAGAPLCPQSSVETRDLARDLAPHTTGTLHVSGCAKGCAFPQTADMTLVGRDGAFDLIRNGAPWDAPMQTGLSPAELNEQTGRF